MASSSSSGVTTALLALLKAYGLYSKATRLGEHLATDSGSGVGGGTSTPISGSGSIESAPVGESGGVGTIASEGSLPAGEFGELGGATYGDTGSVAGTTLGSALGEEASSIGLGGYAALLAPLVMGAISIGRGSGGNEPLSKDATIEDYIAKIGNLYKAAQPDTTADADTLSQYKDALSSLYQSAHQLGHGGYYTDKNQQSTLSDQDIDTQLASKYGLTNDQLQSSLGYYVPNWGSSGVGQYVDWWKDQRNAALNAAAKQYGVTTDEMALDTELIPGHKNAYSDFLSNWDLWAGKPKTKSGTETDTETGSSSTDNSSLFGSTLQKLFEGTPG
jgi:hypothetical protein